MLTFFFIALFFQIGAWAAFSAESVKQDLKKANVIPDGAHVRQILNIFD